LPFSDRPQCDTSSVTQDWAVEELQALLDEAAGLKSSPMQPLWQGRTLALLFLNPSLRTTRHRFRSAQPAGATGVSSGPRQRRGGGSSSIRERSWTARRRTHRRSRRGFCQLLRPHRNARVPRFQELQYDHEDPLIRRSPGIRGFPSFNMRRSSIRARNWRWPRTLQQSWAG